MDLTALDLPFMRPPAWHAEAACAGLGAESFVPGPSGVQVGRRNLRPAERDRCVGCRVMLECLTAAVAGGEVGVWGGTSDRERQRLRRGEALVLVPGIAVRWDGAEAVTVSEEDARLLPPSRIYTVDERRAMGVRAVELFRIGMTREQVSVVLGAEYLCTPSPQQIGSWATAARRPPPSVALDLPAAVRLAAVMPRWCGVCGRAVTGTNLVRRSDDRRQCAACRDRRALEYRQRRAAAQVPTWPPALLSLHPRRRSARLPVTTGPAAPEGLALVASGG